MCLHAFEIRHHLGFSLEKSSRRCLEKEKLWAVSSSGFYFYFPVQLILFGWLVVHCCQLKNALGWLDFTSTNLSSTSALHDICQSSRSPQPWEFSDRQLVFGRHFTLIHNSSSACTALQYLPHYKFCLCAFEVFPLCAVAPGRSVLPRRLFMVSFEFVISSPPELLLSS